MVVPSVATARDPRRGRRAKKESTERRKGYPGAFRRGKKPNSL
jgi:hypothetical protein